LRQNLQLTGKFIIMPFKPETRNLKLMNRPTFGETLKFWAKFGFISFGGPAGQIAMMHEYLVEKKKWISNSKFLHALNYCMLLPGPEAQQLATYMGWLLHGRLGGLAAGILFILPSMFILLGLSIVYVSFYDVSWIYSMFSGLKPAVIAIVVLALLKIARKSLLSPFHYVVAVGAFVCIFFLDVRFPLIILGAILIAAFARYVFPSLFQQGNNQQGASSENESDYVINSFTTISGTGFSPVRFWKTIGVFAALWVIPLGLFLVLSADFAFWQNLSVFFTQAAFVTFGGAYAVLPYVAQVSVEQFGWLTELQMIDGLALGETTPGPLIMVLAFVGFMAGYNHFGYSFSLGTIGLVTTTFYTFLPSFLFIFAGAPIIERTQENKRIKEIFSVVTAAVVGVILNLTIFFGMAVLFPGGFSLQNIDFVALAWVVVSFIALYRLKINMILWIGISALFGLGLYLSGLAG